MKTLQLLCIESIIDLEVSIMVLPEVCQDLINSMKEYKDEYFLKKLVNSGYHYYPFEVYFKTYFKIKPLPYIYEYIDLNIPKTFIYQYYFTEIFRAAIKMENYEIIRYFSTLCDPKTYYLYKDDLKTEYPMEYAVTYVKNLKFIEFMVELGYPDSDPNYLKEAALYGRLDTLKYLIEKYKYPIDNKIMSRAFYYNYFNIVEYLLTIGYTSDGFSKYFYRSCDKEKFIYLTTTYKLIPTDEQLEKMMYYSVDHDDLSFVKYLIEDYEYKYPNLYNLIHIAKSNKSEEMLLYLRSQVDKKIENATS